MEKTNLFNEFKYKLLAIWAAIRGQEIEFVFKQIENWFKGKIVSQKITNAVYSSDVFMELSDDWDKKETAKTVESTNPKPTFVGNQIEISINKPSESGKSSIDMKQGGFHSVFEIGFSQEYGFKLTEVIHEKAS